MKRFLTDMLGAFLLAVVFTMVGCAALGIAAPTKFIDRAAAAQLTVTTARSGALTALNLGTISARDARNVQTSADAGNDAIDVAVAAYVAACPAAPAAASAPPPPPCTSATADAKLAMATAILGAATTYLDKAAAAAKGKP